MGSEKTPAQIRVRFSKSGMENKQLAMKQLLDQGVPIKDVTTFSTIADAEAGPTSGQFEPLTKAAEAIGAEISWY